MRQSLPLEWRWVIWPEYSYKHVREPYIHHNGRVLQLDKCTARFIYEWYVGQVTKVRLSCYLVLLSLITKPGNKAAASSWPDPCAMEYVSPRVYWNDDVTCRFWYVWRRMDWCILRPYIYLRETKLQSFQYKIINRIINCNKKLFDMKIEHSPVCSYCDQTDDIGHLVISSLCVKMCMNSGKGYVPSGIHLIMTMLIFQRSKMWKLSSSDHSVSLKLWLYWPFVYFT